MLYYDSYKKGGETNSTKSNSSLVMFDCLYLNCTISFVPFIGNCVGSFINNRNLEFLKHP